MRDIRTLKAHRKNKIESTPTRERQKGSKFKSHEDNTTDRSKGKSIKKGPKTNNNEDKKSTPPKDHSKE